MREAHEKVNFLFVVIALLSRPLQFFVFFRVLEEEEPFRERKIKKKGEWKTATKGPPCIII